VPQDECASENHVEGQESIDIADLEDAGAWYYVVDCATCKTVIPFKYAPEDEPILLFPTMTVRCFHCHTHHTYAPNLISHRKTAAPCAIFNADQQPSHPSDGIREGARDQQEKRAEGDAGVHVIIGREIDAISSSLPRDNIFNVAINGKRATLFFLSSCFLAAGWASRLALDFYPAALESHSSGLAMLLGIALFGPVFLGLALFIFAIGSFFVETFSLVKSGFARIDSRIASLAVHATRTVALFLSEMRQRKFPARGLPDAGRTLQSRQDSVASPSTGSKSPEESLA
jgi:hypothetical protein